MKNLFNFDECVAKEELLKYDEPWKVIPHIFEIIEATINKIDKNEYKVLDNKIYIHKSCVISKASHIIGPCIIGKGSELRPGAFIRENVIVGENCVIGNSCELKNSIIFNGAQIPHFNYVGDSIIGYKAHFGAGAITSNIKSDKSNIVIKNGSEIIKTDLLKLGALVGDYSEIGCNTVLNPGTIIGKNTTVYPLSLVRGVVPENSIFKSSENIVKKNNKVKAVIFDLDGTILDTKQDLVNSINLTLKHYNKKEMSADEIISHVGNGIRKLVEGCVNPGSEKELDKALEVYLNNYSQQYLKTTHPYEGVKEMIDELDKMGIKIGVNSNKDDNYTKDLIKIHYKNININHVIGNKKEIKRKPAPEAIEIILSDMGINKEETIYIGDSPVDAKTAENAGTDIICVGWGFNKKEDLIKKTNAKVVDKPAEIIEYIKEKNNA